VDVIQGIRQEGGLRAARITVEAAAKRKREGRADRAEARSEIRFQQEQEDRARRDVERVRDRRRQDVLEERADLRFEQQQEDRARRLADEERADEERERREAEREKREAEKIPKSDRPRLVAATKMVTDLSKQIGSFSEEDDEELLGISKEDYLQQRLEAYREGLERIDDQVTSNGEYEFSEAGQENMGETVFVSSILGTSAFEENYGIALQGSLDRYYLQNHEELVRDAASLEEAENRSSALIRSQASPEAVAEVPGGESYFAAKEEEFQVLARDLYRNRGLLDPNRDMAVAREFTARDDLSEGEIRQISSAVNRKATSLFAPARANQILASDLPLAVKAAALGGIEAEAQENQDLFERYISQTDLARHGLTIAQARYRLSVSGMAGELSQAVMSGSLSGDPQSPIFKLAATEASKSLEDPDTPLVSKIQNLVEITSRFGIMTDRGKNFLQGLSPTQLSVYTRLIDSQGIQGQSPTLRQAKVLFHDVFKEGQLVQARRAAELLDAEAGTPEEIDAALAEETSPTSLDQPVIAEFSTSMRKGEGENYEKMLAALQDHYGEDVDEAVLRTAREVATFQYAKFPKGDWVRSTMDVVTKEYDIDPVFGGGVVRDPITLRIPNSKEWLAQDFKEKLSFASGLNPDDIDPQQFEPIAYEVPGRGMAWIFLNKEAGTIVSWGELEGADKRLQDRQHPDYGLPGETFIYRPEYRDSAKGMLDLTVMSLPKDDALRRADDPDPKFPGQIDRAGRKIFDLIMSGLGFETEKEILARDAKGLTTQGLKDLKAELDRIEKPTRGEIHQAIMKAHKFDKLRASRQLVSNTTRALMEESLQMVNPDRAPYYIQSALDALLRTDTEPGRVLRDEALRMEELYAKKDALEAKIIGLSVADSRVFTDELWGVNQQIVDWANKVDQNVGHGFVVDFQAVDQEIEPIPNGFPGGF
jgi:hypothetical protein